MIWFAPFAGFGDDDSRVPFPHHPGPQPAIDDAPDESQPPAADGEARPQPRCSIK